VKQKSGSTGIPVECSNLTHASSKFTKAYEEWLMRMLINSTVQDVSRKEEVSTEDVEGVLSRRIETQVDWNSIEKLSYFGLDEIALKKGHKDFVVIVSSRLCQIEGSDVGIKEK
jgi:transposase